MTPPPFSSLADLPGARAQSRPQAPALRFGAEVLDYAELARRCDDVAAQLWHGWGVRAGDRVAWLGANHPAQLILLFALARIGALLLPLNFRLAPGEWDALVADCTPGHLVHDGAWAAAAQELAARHGLATHPAGELGTPASRQPPQVGEAASPVLLVYTSGTTRRAKAAVHTQASLLANMRIAAAVQQIEPHDVVATMLPLFHVGGLCIQTLPALYAGAQVILHERFSADAALDCFEAQRPTLTLQVPATMKALVEHPRWPGADLSSLRAVWAGSSLLPQALVDAFEARGLPVCNVYGATETGPFSIALPPGHVHSHPGSCGWPAPEVEARLASSDAAGAGELLVRGPNVVARYWPDQPACDADGWFHTGDMAVRAGDGSYTVVGRARDLIISGGENIHPAEIEAVLAGHPAIAECAAFGLADPQWGEVVAVAVVLKPGQTLSEVEGRAHLAGQLARYKWPRRWYWPAELPKTALGKVQRQALVRWAQGDGSAGVAPQGHPG